MASQKEHNVYLQQLSLIARFAKYMSKENSNENSKILKALSSYIYDGCKAFEFSNVVKEIFEDYLSKIESSLVELNPNEILTSYENEIVKIDKNTLVDKCEKYQELLSLTLQKNIEADDEIVTVSQNINNIDPITKLPIAEPVKNSKCGHIYDKNSILLLIKKNPKTKCPFPGCNAANRVLAEDLISDYCFKRVNAEKEINTVQKKCKTAE